MSLPKIVRDDRDTGSSTPTALLLIASFVTALIAGIWFPAFNGLALLALILFGAAVVAWRRSLRPRTPKGS